MSTRVGYSFLAHYMGLFMKDKTLVHEPWYYWGKNFFNIVFSTYFLKLTYVFIFIFVFLMIKKL